jgi:aminobenzoyl-glutamate utilization protein A
VAAQLEALAYAAAHASRASLVTTRRSFHRIPEPGFCEYQTATAIVERLCESGWDLITGADACDLAAAHSVPAGHTAHWLASARAAGGNPALLDAMTGGNTAVVASRRYGPGPTVALRFDIDALPIQESDDARHRPAREGFASTHPGWMHACGHDGHITLGLGVAQVIDDLREYANGTVKLLFQPAEEGTKGGAAAITARGHLDDVALVIAAHLGLNADRTGTIVCNAEFMGTFKYRARFVGRGAHVVLAPHEGRNALLAAAAAATALHAIAPHPDGWFSVNVGVLRAGTEQGVTPAEAVIELGAWFSASELEEYLRARTLEVLRAAAALQKVELEVELIGEAPFVSADPGVGRSLESIAERIPAVVQTMPIASCNAGEDATVMMDRVRRRGGDAAYVLVGSDLVSGHHTPTFDFDEESLVTGVGFLAAAALRRMDTAAGLQESGE